MSKLYFPCILCACKFWWVFKYEAREKNLLKGAVRNKDCINNLALGVQDCCGIWSWLSIIETKLQVSGHHQDVQELSHEVDFMTSIILCCSKWPLLCHPATPCPQNLPRVSHQRQHPLQAKIEAILLLKNPLLNAQFQLQHLLTDTYYSRTPAEVSSRLINCKQLEKPLQPPLWNTRPVSDATEALVKQTAKLFQSSFWTLTVWGRWK